MQVEQSKRLTNRKHKGRKWGSETRGEVSNKKTGHE